MLITGKFTKSTEWILSNFEELDSEFETEFKIDNHVSALKYPEIMSRLKFYDDSFGNWFLFGGYCFDFALIRAKSFESAYEIYLNEFVPNDNGYLSECANDKEYLEETENGSFDSSGNFYSEATTANIVSLNLNQYVFQFEIKAK